jgi:hypothetical protein
VKTNDSQLKIFSMKLVMLSLFLLVSCNLTNANYSATDYRLFEATPIWKLAKAVQAQEVEEIRRLIITDKYDMNFQEPKFGLTLLMLTIVNKHFISFETLLKLKADINIHDSYDGSSAIIDAADLDNINDEWKYLKLLIQKGANPNDEEVGPRQKGNTTRKFALLVACKDITEGSKPLEKVKLLIEAGADVNHRNEYGATALEEAAVFDHYDVVLYLLENGADVHTIFEEYKGKKQYLVDHLRTSLFPFKSIKYEDKMKVVSFLLDQGVDYRRVPIPDYAIQQAKKLYPQTWREYLDHY